MSCTPRETVSPAAACTREPATNFCHWKGGCAEPLVSQGTRPFTVAFSGKPCRLSHRGEREIWLSHDPPTVPRVWAMLW